jgi:FKBP-type peptidyl-prolyl cis-trans isomerase
VAKQSYIQANKDWLAEKAKEEGVKALPKGVYYKVLAEGNKDSLQPTRRSIVTVHYTGKTINGKKFDSSRGGTAPAFRLSELIEGWIIAIQQMHIGDKWEVYIPAKWGYGALKMDDIPAHSTLIFELELVKIER